MSEASAVPVLDLSPVPSALERVASARMPTAAPMLATIERHRARLWAICYRMTGRKSEADDLTQEALTRAIERIDQLTSEDPTGWLLRIATRVCLDHLRKRRVARRVAELVDPLDLPELSYGQTAASPESAAILREDVRFAVVVALQHLSPKQRAALLLRDICDRPVEEIAELLGTNANAVKALVHRARSALERARVALDSDVPADPAVIERMARAIESGSIEALTQLLADDVWGVVDGGGVVQTATRPTFGKRGVSRQWANGKRRLGQDVTSEIRIINGEPAIIIRLAAFPTVIVAIVHAETRGGFIRALRVNRDPARIACLRAD